LSLAFCGPEKFIGRFSQVPQMIITLYRIYS